MEENKYINMHGQISRISVININNFSSIFKKGGRTKEENVSSPTPFYILLIVRTRTKDTRDKENSLSWGKELNRASQVQQNKTPHTSWSVSSVHISVHLSCSYF